MKHFKENWIVYPVIGMTLILTAKELIEAIPKRMNDCFERSLNGQTMKANNKEMPAIIVYINTYIKWTGKEVKKGKKNQTYGINGLPYLNIGAHPQKDAIVYMQKCQSYHGANDERQKDLNGISYSYPPLWGEHSYNNGVGLFRLSRLAGYVKDNMPFNQSTHNSPALTDEEAWDIAAFVNSQPRPSENLGKDCSDISQKLIDHPFNTYADGFIVQQHKS